MIFAYTYSPVGNDSVDVSANGFLGSRLWILVLVVILILLAFFYQNEIVDWKNRQKTKLKAYIKRSFFQIDNDDEVVLHEDGLKGFIWEYIDQHLLPTSDIDGYFDYSMVDSDQEEEDQNEIIVENMQTKTNTNGSDEEEDDEEEDEEDKEEDEEEEDEEDDDEDEDDEDEDEDDEDDEDEDDEDDEE